MTLETIFKRLGNKWNNPARNNLQSNHLHSLPRIQATCSLLFIHSWDRISGEDRTCWYELVLEQNLAGQFLHLHSQGPLWESRDGRGELHRSLQACWVSEVILEASIFMAEEGWTRWKAPIILLRWVISPLKRAISSCISWFDLQLLNGLPP